ESILRVHHGQETYWLGQLGAHSVVLTMCAMGSTSRGAAILATADAIELWHPAGVIMPGIAFGAHPNEQTIADVLLATPIMPYENQRVGKIKMHRAAQPESGQVLLNRIKNVRGWEFKRPNGSLCGKRFGPLLSGEKLVDDPTFKAELLGTFPSAIGGEME